MPWIEAHIRGLYGETLSKKEYEKGKESMRFGAVCSYTGKLRSQIPALVAWLETTHN